nr:hypothetical protein Itr_chr14CG16660 [Ipomoea trifida]
MATHNLEGNQQGQIVDFYDGIVLSNFDNNNSIEDDQGDEASSLNPPRGLSWGL